jgi:DNA replication protein DnaC
MSAKSTIIRELDPRPMWQGMPPVRWAEWLCACGEKFEQTAEHKGPICGKCRQADRDREEAEHKERAAASRERNRQHRILATLENVLPRYRESTFDSAKLPQRVRPTSAIAKAQSAIDARALLIVLLGPAGAGKTSLGVALLLAIAAKIDTVGSFYSTFEISESRRQNRLGAGEAEAVKEAMEADALLLDELGAEKTQDTAVHEIIRHRHDGEMVTIYTTGFTEEQITTKYGPAIARRIFEGAVVLRLGGK